MEMIFLLFWLICSAISYAGNFAYWYGHFPTTAESHYRESMSAALWFGLFFGPLGLIVSFFLTGFFKYGLKWK